MSEVLRLAADVALRRAPNPGPMTLDGTNSYLLGDPEAGPVLLVDPGPEEPASGMATHHDELLAAAPHGLAAVILTHRHLDHSGSAAAVAAGAGCGVRAADPAFRVGPDGLAGGDRLAVGGTGVRVLSTPGHTADSVCLLLTPGPGRDQPWLLTGDTVLGRGSSVITEPDGDLAAYLDSLDRLIGMLDPVGVARLLPGHGPVRDDPGVVLRGYRTHRQQRLAEVRDALGAGAVTAADVVARVYADVDRSLWPAAEQSVRAQLAYLRTAESHSQA